MKDDIRFEIVEVTPEMAKAFLARNAVNRRISREAYSILQEISNLAITS